MRSCLQNKLEDLTVTCLEVSGDQCYNIECSDDKIYIDESRFFDELEDADRPNRRACLARFLADVISDDCCLRSFWKGMLYE